MWLVLAPRINSNNNNNNNNKWAPTFQTKLKTETYQIQDRTFPWRVKSEYRALRKSDFLIFQSIFATYNVLLGADITSAMFVWCSVLQVLCHGGAAVGGGSASFGFYRRRSAPSRVCRWTVCQGRFGFVCQRLVCGRAQHTTTGSTASPIHWFEYFDYKFLWESLEFLGCPQQAGLWILTKTNSPTSAFFL